MKGLVVAAPASGSGKTSVALGLMAALARRGLAVAPFKVGPDFIDPGHHALAAGRESQTLDGWMMPRTAVEDTFAWGSTGSDVAVVEGVMGLFDGFSAVSDEGSTAEIAKWLGLPVLLVVDARAMARSAAALVHGFASFDPDLSLAGVVFNRVGSERHAQALTEAVDTACPGIPVLGALSRREEIVLPSRHLGLVTARESMDTDLVDSLVTWVEDGIDIPALLAALPRTAAATAPPPAATATSVMDAVRIGVARDAAFCFYYPENLRRLEAAGAELVFFSPCEDDRLPEGLDGLYLGGGYPELHARELANQVRMRREVAALCASGRPVYAECGGFMYLLRDIADASRQVFPMCGIFPYRATMNTRRAALGYRQITTTGDSLLGPEGSIARGHEFRYSSISDEAYADARLFRVEDRRGPVGQAEGFTSHNVVASYIHLHFASSPGLTHHFVDACRKARAALDAAEDPA